MEAEALIEAVPAQDRPIWATAMYAGLRRGELQALRADDVDLDSGLIRVEFGWSTAMARFPSSRMPGGARCPSLASSVRSWLAAWPGRTATEGKGSLVCVRAVSPFDPSKLIKRADRAWREAALRRITLHECRHTFASLMIAAGVNAKALQIYMGHANISITLDRYGHLMPGTEAEAAGLCSMPISRRSSAARTKARLA